MNKREFLKGMVAFIPVATLLGRLGPVAEALGDTGKEKYDAKDHWYGMGIEIEKCIGCNRCVEACKAENNVPDESAYFRTWVERYTILGSGETAVECISVKDGPRRQPPDERDIVRTFFVPKLCNHCAHPPCVQVCPVGATFATQDGVVLVDSQRCIGCRYCIQACPYGARYLHPQTKTADKCTFCYHRIRKGLLPACVEVCPTQARVFGDVESKASPLGRLRRMGKPQVLKPYLNTEPRVFYTELDGEVR